MYTNYRDRPSVSQAKTLLQKGCDCMATKSVLKTIDIKERRSVLTFVRAMEHAKEKTAQPVCKTRSFSDASREEIKKMFGDKK